MKKNYLAVLGILMFLLPLSVAGQELVWSNSFDSSTDLQGWAFHDLDGNGNQWVQGKNWYSDPNNSYQTTEGTENVLRYSNGKLDNTYVSNFDLENNWIISPEIDLEGASGLIQLAVDWRLMDTRQHQISLDIYISESPDLANFETLSLDASPYFLSSNDMEPWASAPNEFSQTIMDISTFAGKKIYIGLKRAGSSVDQYQLGNLNIDEIGIYAENYSAPGVAVTGVTLDKSTLSLVAGTSETLVATVSPDGATDKEVTWSSSNEAAATVDATGKVTAVAAGTAEITVTTKDGGKTAKCTVTVTAAVDYSWLKAAAIAVEGNFAKVVGPDADTFTLFYINDQAATLTDGQADLTGKTGELSLKATTTDASGVIKLNISK